MMGKAATVAPLDFSAKVLLESGDLLARIRQLTMVTIEQSYEQQSLQNLESAVTQALYTFQLIGSHGAELLCSELVSLIQSIAEKRIDPEIEVSPVLILASEKLNEYVAYLKSDAPDLPLALLACCNNLRACHGKSLLSEALIVEPLFSIPESGSLNKLSQVRIGQLARFCEKVRLPLIQSLVDWYRSPDDDSVQNLKAVFAEIRTRVPEAEISDLWMAAEAIATSLGDGGLEDSAALKKLFAHIERYLKVCSEAGESGKVLEYPTSLMKNLLYYTALSESVDPLVVSVKEKFRLNELLPPRATIERARGALGGPSANLTDAICASVNRELAEVKQSLDSLGGSALDESTEISELIDRLSQLSSTLLLLGLSGAKSLNERAISTLGALVGVDANLQEPKGNLLSAASDLLRVEAAVGEYLHGKARTAVFAENFDRGMSIPGKLSVYELDAIVSKCLNESVKAVKTVQADYLQVTAGKSGLASLVESAGTLEEVASALQILPLPELKPLLDGAANHLRALVSGGQLPTDDEQEHFASLIVSCEFYLDADLQRQPAASDLLICAETALDALQLQASESDEQAETLLPVFNQLPMEREGQSSFVESSLQRFKLINDNLLNWKESGDRESLKIIQSGWQQFRDEGFDNNAIALSDLGDANERMIARLLRRANAPAAAANAKKASATETIRSAEVEGLLEESCGMLLQLINLVDQNHQQKSLPANSGLDAEPLEGFTELLKTVEASVSMEDTGSGSDAVPDTDMDAAIDSVAGSLSDRESDVDSDLNQTLDLTENITDEDWLEKTLSIHPPSLDAGGEAPVRQPEGELNSTLAVSDVERDLDTTGLTPESNEIDKTLAIQADQLDDASLVETQVHLADDAELAQTDPADVSGSKNSTLYNVFFNECHVHLEQLKDQLGSALVNEKLVLPTEQLLRSLHTLNGSARTAGFSDIVELTAPLERISRDRLANDQRFNRNEVVVISDAVLALDNLCIVLESGEPLPQNHQEICQALTTFVDRASSTTGRSDNSSDLQHLFIDEASELLDRMQPAVKQLAPDGHGEQQKKTSAESLGMLQADLHTLKGAAHVAGYRAIADLTHALEGALHRWDSKTLLQVRQLDLIQDTLDAITMNLEQARSGGSLGQFEWLVGELNSDRSAEESVRSDESELDLTVPITEVDSLPDISEPLAAEETPALIGTSSDDTATLDATVSMDKEPVADADRSAKDSAGEESAPQDQAINKRSAVRPLASFSALNQVGGGAAAVQSSELAAGSQDRAVPDDQIRLDARAVKRLSDLACEASVHQAIASESVYEMQNLMVDLDKTTEQLGRKLKEMQQGVGSLPGQWMRSAESDEPQDHTTRFDPEELERHTQALETSRQLGEVVADFEQLRVGLSAMVREAEERLGQSARIGADIQQTLVQSRLLPFNQHATRLGSTVRQTAAALNKKVDWRFEGADTRIERALHKGVLAPIEHLIRNAIVHGVETSEQRLKVGKSSTGQITLSVRHEGAMLILTVTDDGAGVDRASVNEKLSEQSLDELADEQDLEALFKPGFTTLSKADEFAGRGIGLDAVRRFVTELGGSVRIESVEGQGTTVHMRFPQPEAINQVVVVEGGGIHYGLPVNYVRTVKAVTGYQKEITFDNQVYTTMRLTDLVTDQSQSEQNQSAHSGDLSGRELSMQAVLIEVGDVRVALRVHSVPGYRELVTTTVGKQVQSLTGVTGASILANGSCVIMPDLTYLLNRPRSMEQSFVESVTLRGDVLAYSEVLVVDDSITMRAYAEKVIRSTGKQVVFARDGIEALEYLERARPSLVLLDLEMPRLDGFGLLGKLRAMPEHDATAVVVVSSRSSVRHRERAADLGVIGYLVKPYRAEDLGRIFERLEKTPEY